MAGAEVVAEQAEAGAAVAVAVAETEAAGAVKTVASILCWPTSPASTAGSINILRTSVHWGAATRRSKAALRKVSAARKMLKNIAYIWEQLLLLCRCRCHWAALSPAELSCW